MNEALKFAEKAVKKHDAAMVGKPKYQRIDRDAYFTPPWCTKVLLDHYPFFRKRIWEPACGEGNISKVLLERGFLVYSTDIHNYRLKFQRQDMVTDFLEENFYDTDYDIITNPPFFKALKFVNNALKITKKNKGRVAMLLRNEWDSAKTRVHLFNQPPFTMKIVLNVRPKWIENSKDNPRHNFAWFVWDWNNENQRPILSYSGDVDINK